MKIFDYTPYDELHQSLIDFYGSEWKLKFAILKDQHPGQYMLLMGSAVASATKALGDFNKAISRAAQNVSRIKFDVKW